MGEQGTGSGRELVERLRALREALARSEDPLRDPLGVGFSPMPGPAFRAEIAEYAARARSGRAHPSLVLYVHVPFCARVCSYCLLAARPAERRDVIDRYVEALVAEMHAVSALLEGLPISAMHVGGGTPTVLSSEQLARVLDGAAAAFERTPGFVAGIEAHPASTSAAKLEVMVARGVRRVSFGVESFTPAVLAHVGRREQTSERVRRAAQLARDAGIEHVNVDLLAGLPGETVESFEASAAAALELPIDSMSVNRFLAEGSLLGRFGATGGDPGEVGAMLLAADRVVRERRPPSFPREPLRVPAYGTQYVWERDQRRYFQEDMIGPATTIAVGHGGMAHVHGGAYAIAGVPLAEWIDAQLEGAAPDVLAWSPPPRFEAAFYLADRLRRGELFPRDFARVFGEAPEARFADELAALEVDGGLSRGDERWRSDRPAIELLAFLANTSASGAPPPVEGGAALDRLLELAPEGAAFDVGAGVSNERAQELADEASRRKLTVVTRGAERVAEAQYRAAGDELPPSLLWCRLAIRAIAAMRAMEAAAQPD